MRKSDLLKAIQSEINRHGLDTFSVRVDNGNIVTPGCPLCRKTLYTKSGEQEVILSATSACSKAEWLMLLAGLGMVDPES